MEGRRAFLARCSELEAGEACERWRGVLAAIAGGEVRADELTALRPHLRRCAACRATLRALHADGAAMSVTAPQSVSIPSSSGGGGKANPRVVQQLVRERLG